MPNGGRDQAIHPGSDAESPWAHVIGLRDACPKGGPWLGTESASFLTSAVCWPPCWP